MRRAIPLVVIAVLALAAAAVARTVHHWRPLIRSSEWSAVYTVGDSEEREAKVCAMLLRPSRHFVILPDDAPLEYRSFAVAFDLRCVAKPVRLRTFPYLSYNHDMAIGLVLDDPKMDDDWQIEWGEDEIRFTNPEMAVRVFER